MVKDTDFIMGSLNVRGINNKIKRRGVFEWATCKDIDILMLQECYCSKSNVTEWSDEWKGKFIFSHGSKHSRGTIVLFRKGFDMEIVTRIVTRIYNSKINNSRGNFYLNQSLCSKHNEGKTGIL